MEFNPTFEGFAILDLESWNVYAVGDTEEIALNYAYRFQDISLKSLLTPPPENPICPCTPWGPIMRPCTKQFMDEFRELARSSPQPPR